MTVEKVINTLAKYYHRDSGLPEEDREALFAAYCFCQANFDAFQEAIQSTAQALSE